MRFGKSSMEKVVDSKHPAAVLFDGERLVTQKDAAIDFVKKNFPTKPKLYVHIGIGGSSLGVRAVSEYLRSNVQTIFVEEISADALSSVRAAVEKLSTKEECIVMIASKSGNTLETLANADAVLAILQEKFGDVSAQCIVATLLNSNLAAYAQSHAMHICPMSLEVGGRFSIFESYAQVALLLQGTAIDELYRGAIASLQDFLENGEESPVYMKVDSFVHIIKKHDIAERIIFSWGDRLGALGEWWRQLYAESLGKKSRADIMPTISSAKGSRDMHSIAQLLLASGNKRFFDIVSLPQEIQATSGELVSTSNISAQKLSVINQVILEAVLGDLVSRDIAIQSTELKPALQSIGAYMMDRIIETVLIADMLGIDAFNQPEVESYKKRARELLTKSSKK